MQYNQIDNIIAQQQFPNKFYDLLSLLKNDTDTGSLANAERSESDDILGSEKYPGEMLSTFGITNLLPEEADRLALYYKSIYGDSYKARSGGWKMMTFMFQIGLSNMEGAELRMI
jgi:hypothetical protein